MFSPGEFLSRMTRFPAEKRTGPQPARERLPPQVAGAGYLFLAIASSQESWSRALGLQVAPASRAGGLGV